MSGREKNIRVTAIKLALAGGIEYALQVAMPVILVRYLDVASFGQYRMLWLLAATAMAIAPCFMPQSLFYFLPRAHDKEQRAILLSNTVVYLLAAGLVSALVACAWNPLLPATASALFHSSHGASSLFLGLWVFAALFDVLPTADGRAHWNATATIALAVLRTVLLGLAAWLSSDVGWVIWAMLIVVLVKVVALSCYLWLNGAARRFRLDGPAFKLQLAYALPFALGNAMFLMRLQSDQWVVASMMSPALYAIFSIATVLQPVSTLIRQPVFNAVMPHLNRAFASGDVDQVRSLIAKSSSAAAFFLLPVAGALLASAPELVAIVYTDKFSATAPIMQVYVVGMIVTAFAVGHLLPVVDKGRFATLNNGICLLLSISISVAGVKYLGLIGGALGSVITLGISELWSALVIARALKTRVADLLGLRSLLPTCCATIAAVVAALLAGHLLAGPPLLLVAIKYLVYGMIFLSTLFMTGGRAKVAMLMRYR